MPVTDQTTWADQVADAFQPAGLGEIMFPAPSACDGDTTRLLIELCARHGHTANDAVRAQGAIARHLGVVPEGRLTVQLVSLDSRSAA